MAISFVPRLITSGLWLFACTAYGQTGESPTFDVASIKPCPTPPDRSLPGPRVRYTPDGITASGVRLDVLVMEAYQFPPVLIQGLPGWTASDLFDLNAKAARPAEKGEIRRMLQTLLAERCRLVAHRETKEMSLYDMTVKDESKLYKLKDGADKTNEDFNTLQARTKAPYLDQARYREAGGGGAVSLTGTMDTLAISLSKQAEVGRPVINKTGLEGTYMIVLQFYRGEFVEDLQSVFGLKLTPRKGMTELLVIDHMERPSAN